MSNLWFILAAACGAVYLLGVIAAAVACRRGDGAGRMSVLLVLLAAALLVRMLIAPWAEGYATDVGAFTAWAGRAAAGLEAFYSDPDYFADYPPGYMYVLWVVGKLQAHWGLEWQSPEFLLLLKMPAILADVAATWLVYRLARRHKLGAPAAVAALYAFNPAVILDSAVWGQVDGVLVLGLLAGVMLLRRFPWASGAAFAAALLIKPQALLLGPLPLLCFAVRLIRRRERRAILDLTLFLAAGLAVFAAGVLPYVMQYGPTWVVTKYTSTMNSYPYASLNAFNLFALVGGNGVDTATIFHGLTYAQWGTLSLVLTLALAVAAAMLAKDDTFVWYVPVLLVVSVFVLGTMMHERYLFPALALVLGLYVVTRDWRVLVLLGGLSVTLMLNIAEVLALSHHETYLVPPEGGLLLACSAANVLLWAWMIWIGVRLCTRRVT